MSETNFEFENQEFLKARYEDKTWYTVRKHACLECGQEYYTICNFRKYCSDIMLTVRPLNKNGTWQHKTEKKYLCIRNGEERGFTASEYLQAQKDGWEKQYQYKVGKVKEYLPPSRAEDLERVNKYPKSSKYGRQNPISAEWNSEEQISRWREAWERCVNRALQENEIDQRIDHRSHKARGLLIKPTIHEGVIAIAMERKGYKSDRRAFNRSIFRYNETIENWVKAIEYLIKSVFLAVSRLADEMEDVRSDLIGLAYDQRRGYNLTEAMQDTMERFDQLKEKADGLDTFSITVSNGSTPTRLSKVIC